MRIRTFGSVIALSSAATVVVTACGDDTTVRTTEPCQAGLNECVSDKVGRACPEGPEPGWVYFACGDTEVCEMGACVLDESQAGRLGLCSEDQKECVSDALARQCAKGGNAWLPLACPSGTVCDQGDCVPAGDAGGIQICNPGAVECATEYAVKTCQNDGSEWVISLCQAGELCQDGACVPNRDGACVPNTSQCLDSTSGLRCREDGQGYDEFSCPAEAPCDGFKCQGTVCTPGETKCPDPEDEFEESDVVDAVNGHHFAGSDVFQCNPQGNGWEVIPCDPGNLCVYSSLTPSEAQAYEDLYITYMQEWIAADNSGDSDAYPVAPVFIHPPNRFMAAACIDPVCDYAVGSLMGELVCGSPDDPSMDKVGNYSQCEGLAPFSTPQWVPYTCQAPEMCNPMEAYYGNGDPCSTDCIPDEVVCGSYFGGDYDSVYGCNQNGEWEEQQSCNQGVDKAQTCFQNAQMEDGDLRSAQCVDPLCAHIWSIAQYGFSGYDAAYYGFCDGGELRTCDESGQVVPAGEATACGSGVCYDSGDSFEDSGYGYTLGWCEEECQDGETRCVDIYGTNIDYYGWGEANSPFFMTCNNGVWERGMYEACPPDVVGEEAPNCFQIWEPAQENENIAKVVCGGECQPGFRQCNYGEVDPNDNYVGIQTCGDDAMWGDTDTCDVGSCVDEHNNYSFWDAECVFDCVPGTYTSTWNYLADAGQYYYGELLCGEDGRFPDPEDAVRCDGPALNVYVDERVGCYECYGPELAYYWGNYWSNYFNSTFEVPVESKCDLDGNIVWCGQDNMWEDGVSCGQGNTCYPYSSRTADYPYYAPGDRAYCAEAVPVPPAPDAGDGGDGGQTL
jgi:hypothetical protein